MRRLVSSFLTGYVACLVSVCWAQKTHTATGSGLKAGLKGEYFSGTNFEKKLLTRTDPTIAFDWNWQYAAPGVPHEYMSVRWTGHLRAPSTGTYRFSATADDGVRVWVAGKKIIDEWRKQDDSNFTGTVFLRAGQRYALRVEYFNDWKGSVIYLLWEPPLPKRSTVATYARPEPIPTQYLSPLPVPKLAKPVPSVAAHPVVAAAQPLSPKRTAAPGVPSAIGSNGQPVVESFAQLSSGQTVVLNHVFFAQSSYTLLPESYAELDKLAQVLRKTPDITIEIAGHTDNVGDARLNQTLSEYRAKIVSSYLIQQGVPEQQVIAKGYGGNRPITDNKSETRRAQNRRVEITVR